MLLLASQSPTRRQLLENTGIPFRVVPATIDERATGDNLGIAAISGPQLALLLAETKAKSVSEQHRTDLVIGADQILVHNDMVLHKPEDMRQAEAQLTRLRGDCHELHAAVVLARNGEIIWEHVDTARLSMRAFPEDELREILAMEGKKLLDSVGSYRLEGASIRLFDKIEGDYFTILGLPLLALLDGLRQNMNDD